MPRHELLVQVCRWVGRLNDAQLEALAADLRESVPEVCDQRYDSVVARVRDILAGQEDAEGVVRLLRAKGCLREVLRR